MIINHQNDLTFGPTSVPLFPPTPLTPFFAPQLCRAAIVHSEEPVFAANRETLPPCLQKLQVGKELWDLILAPASDPSLVTYRQEILERLTTDLAWHAAVELGKKLQSLESAFRILASSVREQFGTSYAIDLYRSAHKDSQLRAFIESEYGPLVDEMDRALATAVTVRDSTWVPGTLTPERHPELHQTWERLCSVTGDCCKETILSESFQTAQFIIAMEHGETVTKEFGILLAAAQMIVEEQLKKVDFDPMRPVGYENGFSVLCPDSRNHRNPSVPDEPVTVYAGVNKSGKSETGLKQDFVIQLLAQSLGFSTVAPGGNFRFYERIAFLDRCMANERGGLSAYGTETKHAIEAIVSARTAGGPICLYWDEGFATTGPGIENQPTMWFSVVEAVTRAHPESRIRATTHNPYVVSLSSRLGGYQVFHFEVLFSGEKPTYRFKLCTGPDDARSILVARGQQFDPVTLALAERSYLGQMIPPLPPIVRTSPLPKEYLASERDLQLRSSVVTTAPAGPKLLTTFGEVRPGQSFYPPRIYGERFDFGGTPSRRIDFCGWRTCVVPHFDTVKEYIFDARGTSPQETLERHRTFSAVISDPSPVEPYERLVKLREQLAFARRFLPELRTYPELLSSFNITMNPQFSRLDSTGEGENLDSAIAYLAFNRALLGPDFNYHRLSEYAEEFGRLAARADALCGGGNPNVAADPALQSELMEFGARPMPLDDRHEPVKRSDWVLRDPITLDAVQRMSGQIAEEVFLVTLYGLPRRSFHDCDLEPAKTLLSEYLALVIRTEAERGRDYEESTRWPKHLLTALWLEQAIAGENCFEAIEALLQGYDSIELRELSARWKSSVITAESEDYPDPREYVRKVARQYEIARLRVATRTDAILSPIREYLEALGIWDILDLIRGGTVESSSVSRLASVLTAIARKEPVDSDLKYQISTPGLPRGVWEAVLAWQERKLSDEGFSDRYFLHLGDRERVRAMQFDLLAQLRNAEQGMIVLCTEAGLSPSVDLDYSYSLEEEPKLLTTIFALRDRLVSDQLGILPRDPAEGSDTVLERAAPLFLLSQHMKHERFVPVRFTEDGEIYFRGLRHPHKLDDTPQDVEFKAGVPGRFLVGPNMSGKSHFEKKTCLVLLWGMVTGRVPADEARMPYLDQIVFVERVTGKDDNTLSGATMELRNFDAVIKLCRAAPGLVYVGADELFSAMPAGAVQPGSVPDPDYGKHFTVAVAHSIVSTGAILSLSSHNPGAIRELQRLLPGGDVWSFKFVVDREAPHPADRIRFLREPVGWEAPSEAVVVAQTLGFPDDALELGRSAIAQFRF